VLCADKGLAKLAVRAPIASSDNQTSRKSSRAGAHDAVAFPDLVSRTAGYGTVRCRSGPQSSALQLTAFPGTSRVSLHPALPLQLLPKRVPFSRRISRDRSAPPSFRCCSCAWPLRRRLTGCPGASVQRERRITQLPECLHAITPSPPPRQTTNLLHRGCHFGRMSKSRALGRSS